MPTLTLDTKGSNSLTGDTPSVAGVYGLARYGISTYGTAVANQGMFTNDTKSSSTLSADLKN